MAAKSFRKKMASFLPPKIFKLLIFFIGLTGKRKWIGMERLEKLEKSGQNFIYAVWHNNISYCSFLFRNKNIVCLISSSSDGSIASDITETMGNLVVRGSSSRGGAGAAVSMIRKLKEGYSGAVTPDGPRGPKYKLRNGIVVIAQKSGLPVVPVHIEGNRQWIFSKSWDKHKLPKPFSTVVVSVGEPFWIPPKLSGKRLEKVSRELEKAMLANAKRALSTAKNLKKSR